LQADWLLAPRLNETGVSEKESFNLNYRALLSEYFGTTVLVATVVGSGIMGTNLSDDMLVALLVNGLSTVFVLGILILTLGPVSGAHFNPLVTIALATIFLKEKLNALQWVAVGLGTAAVLVMTFSLGQPPIIALVLALSFGIYGLAKNRLGGTVSALNSFTIETTLLLPLGIAQLVFLATISQIQFGYAGLVPSLGLAAYGFLTAIPLLLFGAAAKRVPLSYIGFMQYLTPTLQFLLGLFYFQEQMSGARWFGFAMVWFALAILSFDALRQLSNRARPAPVIS
jgi:chloramphenicol-sensitive protein RarD